MVTSVRSYSDCVLTNACSGVSGLKGGQKREKHTIIENTSTFDSQSSSRHVPGDCSVGGLLLTE